jgi:hypothetical protein
MKSQDDDAAEIAKARLAGDLAAASVLVLKDVFSDPSWPV